MVIIILAFWTFCLQASLQSEFSYSKAADLATAGQWQEAQMKMNRLIVDEPDRADLLYDNGVAAYKLKEYEKARAYFQDVIAKENVPTQLKEQAYFNLGNTFVGLKKLEDAIKHYEEALKIDPADKKAKHNLEKVKQMLQQQQDNKNDQQQEDQDQKNNQNKDKKNQKGNQKKDKQQDASGGQDQEDKQQGKENNKKDNDEKNDESGNNKQEEQDSKQQDDRQQDDKSKEKPGNDDSDNDQDQQGKSHASSPKSQKNDDKRSGSSKEDKQIEAAEQEMQEGSVADKAEQEKQALQQQLKPHEQWMARILERREKADEKASKQMIKATIDSKLSGYHGQNNW